MAKRYSLAEAASIAAILAVLAAGATYGINKIVEYNQLQRTVASMPQMQTTVAALSTELAALHATVDQLDGFRHFMEELMRLRHTQTGPLDPSRFYNPDHTHAHPEATPP